MNSLNKKTPARLTNATTKKLPRWILLLVAVGYIFIGLFFKDAWKYDDAIGLATMLSTYQQELNQGFIPHIYDFIYSEEGPLLSWIGALFIYLFSPIVSLFTESTLSAQITAARLSNFFYFFIILWCVWYSTYLLARRPECQPLKLPFGGDPDPKDYGRMLSDCAFLFIIASIGIVIRMHETSTAPLIMAVNALGFYGLVRMLNLPKQGAIIFAFALITAFLSRGLIGFTPLLISAVFSLFYSPYNKQQRIHLGLALLVSLLVLLAFYLYAHNTNPIWLKQWTQWNIKAFSITSGLSNFLYTLRDLSWFTWPSWPFALIALWQWRKWFISPHIFFPSILLLSHLIILATLKHNFELEYTPLIIPIAILATMAIPTLRRSAINLLDWFSIMIFSLVIFTLYLAWFILYFNLNDQLHHNIYRLITGFSLSPIPWLSALIGFIFIVLWYLVINWRLKKQPSGLWRGLVLSSAGLTLAWSVLVILWQPAINHGRSYKDVAQQISQEIQAHPNQCVNSQYLALGQRALFYIYGNIHINEDEKCALLLVQTTTDDAYRNQSTSTRRYVIWNGSRISERHNELFQLIYRPIYEQKAD